MVVNVHPWVMGWPWRSKYLDRALAHISKHPNVWKASGRKSSIGTRPTATLADPLIEEMPGAGRPAPRRCCSAESGEQLVGFERRRRTTGLWGHNMLRLQTRNVLFLLAVLSPLAAVPPRPAGPAPFRVEEATIAGMHAAIQSGQTTCRRWCRRTSIAPRRTTACARRWSPPTVRRFRRRRATSARARRWRSRPRRSRRRPCFRISTSTKDSRSISAGWSRPCPTRACCTRWACASASRTRAS